MKEDSGFFSPEELETLMLFFLDQAATLLDNANQSLLRLETRFDDVESLSQLQRTLHTLKGDANSVGFGEIGTVAHKLEDLIALWGGVNVESTIEILDLLLFGIDSLTDMLERKRQWVHAPLEIDSIVDRIEGFVGKHVKSRNLSDKQIDIELKLNEYQKLRIKTALQNEPVELCKLVARFDIDCSMHGAGLLILLREISRVGEIVASFPDIEDEQVEELDKVIIILLAEDLPRIEKVANVVGVTSEVTITKIKVADVEGLFSEQESKLLYQSTEQDKPKEISIDIDLSKDIDLSNKIVKPNNLAKEQTIETQNIVQQSKENLAVELLRVSVDKVNLLMDLVGELIINRSMLNQISQQLKTEFSKNPRINRLVDIDAQLGRLLGQMQKAVLEVRMISLDQTFNRFFRVIRDLAKEGGKQIELLIIGEETELDKRVVDIIYEPLLHLVRNAVDHGIEPIEERIKNNKSPQGKIILEAYHQSDQVVIKIQDDGRGIDITKLKEKAVEKKLRTKAEIDLLSDQEAYDLMFLSGISTASQITNVSGRGVGMDVVKMVVSDLKGSIEVSSVLGKSTVFTLILPLTLAIIKAMLFSLGERVFALPLNSIVEIIRLNKEDIQQIGKHKVLSKQDTLYSLIDLSAILLGNKQDYTNAITLVIGLGERRIGVVVEKVIGEKEIVVKAVDQQWITSDLVTGASILGDGRIVLILDVGAIFRRSSLSVATK
ncbi:MAG: chemotaxis protein CheA [Blastocatellia bacterium]|nr:chemotaxis protein CheA [Blastocatellia bacterium]